MTEAKVADEGSIIGYRAKAKERGKEIVCEAVGVGGEWTIPILPRGFGVVEWKVIHYVRSEEMGDLLKDALRKKAEAGLEVGDLVGDGRDGTFNIVNSGGKECSGKRSRSNRVAK